MRAAVTRIGGDVALRLTRGAPFYLRLVKSTLPLTRRRRANDPMSLTLSDVNRIAHLAQLEIDPAKAETALGQLNDIFALAEQMQAVDTRGVAPLSQPLEAVLDCLALRLREDVVTESDRRCAYQSVAPATEDGLYLVPKVIE